MGRSCGVIAAVSSLPSPYGIGTIGAAARSFVDFLAQAGQSWWQVLPVGPTSYGDSPYQSPSSFAGNPYLIDLDQLIEDGLLDRDEVTAIEWGSDPEHVDYGVLFRERLPLLRKAYRRGWERDQVEVAAFAREHASWLDDYALFMALKQHFGMASWTQWPDAGARLRRPDALTHYRSELADERDFHVYLQYLFFRQWDALRAYAHGQGVRIIGDVPIYVALDSADAWAGPQWFQLGTDNLPTQVAGVPPDYFNADGQLWGNPLYDYDAMRVDGFGWWVRRMDGIASLYDTVRLDHFRGFESYWSVPAGERTARNGRWVKGPGMELVGTLLRSFPQLSFIAEDLGYVTPEVARLLEDSGLPGMKVLELAFDSREATSYLPHLYDRHCVCYTGTHDNAPIMGWRGEAAPADVQTAIDYLGLNSDEGFNWGVIRGGMSSVADLFMAQMQDYLGLGSTSRMNTPGYVGGNWQWRLTEGQLTDKLAMRMAKMVRLYGRKEGTSWQR